MKYYADGIFSDRQELQDTINNCNNEQPPLLATLKIEHNAGLDKKPSATITQRRRYIDNKRWKAQVKDERFRRKNGG